jgi:nitroreductase
MVAKEDILNAFHFRHACKTFDKSKTIDNDEMEFLLECARLSPTSFGMEQHRILHIKDKGLREQLRPACWDQDQITSCSDLLVFKAVTKEVMPNSEYVKAMFARRGLPQEHTQAYLKRYEDFLSDKDITCWSQKQCYITLANVMSVAAMRGIDSCAIEGFETKAVEDILNIDTGTERVAVMVALGYRVNEAGKKYRLEKDRIIQKV